MMAKYPVLERKILERGIKKKTIADAINVSYRTLMNKMHGNVAFKWDEVCTIQERFLPDMELREIFSHTA